MWIQVKKVQKKERNIVWRPGEDVSLVTNAVSQKGQIYSDCMALTMDTVATNED